MTSLLREGMSGKTLTWAICEASGARRASCSASIGRVASENENSGPNLFLFLWENCRKIY